MEEKEIRETTEEVTSRPQRVTTTKVIKDPQVKTTHPQVVYDTKKTIFRSYQIIWYILGVVEVLLTFRFVLKILGADPGSGFTSFVYAISDPFAVPFLGVLRTSVAPSVGSIFEWSTLVAMAVYWIVAFGLIQLFQFIKPVSPDEVEDTVDSQ